MSDDIETVRKFLAAMEARDLEGAAALLAPEFVMIFPGGREMRRLEDLLDWAGARYRFARKSFDRFDVCDGVVYAIGTLAGEWPDGTGFSGVRFIDRFEIAAGRLRRQEVWNDMAEMRPG